MRQPQLSVIIPSFNSGKTIGKALQSIVSQLYKDYECMVIDGGSTDNTLAIIAEFSKKHQSIRYHSEPDKGIYDAMNKGIQSTSGQYLYFMGSDDELYNNSVFEGIFSPSNFTSDDFIYGKVIFKHSGLPFGGPTDYFKVIRNLENICHQAILYKRTIFETMGLYDLHFPIYADFNLNVKCFANNTISKKYIDSIFCIFNEKGASSTRGRNDFFIQELHRQYITNHEDPVALYASAKFAQKQVIDLLNSRDYRVGKLIGNTIRRIRKLLRFSPTTKK
jgi:glycosyltransferase involved in cell wall biosynthesis